MAVLVELEVPGATLEEMYAVEELTRQRGEALGGPPYAGCLFLAVTHVDGVINISSAWRTEGDFRQVLDTMMGPDLATVGREVSAVTIAPILSMAIPGRQEP